MGNVALMMCVPLVVNVCLDGRLLAVPSKAWLEIIGG